MSDVKVKWYRSRVRGVVEGASQEFLGALALQVEAQTKANIVANDQVDTGFMLNSVYSVSVMGSTYGEAQMNAGGTGAGRSLAPERDTPKGYEALVGVGAGYAIYQEMRNSFLFRAAELVLRDVGGTAKRVYERWMG